MKKKIMLATLLCLVTVHTMSSSLAWGFVFFNPTSGTAVDVGSTVTVSVDPQGVGPLVGILFTAYGSIGGRVLGSDFIVLPPYRWTLQLPRDYVGPVTFNAMGRVLEQKTGTPPEAEITIMIKLPSSVILQQIRVRNDQKNLFMKVNGKTQIRVYGQFSDGIERHVESASGGTTYSGSDEKIAIVNVDGLITALAPGKAVITIRNGDKQLTINVSVKPI